MDWKKDKLQSIWRLNKERLIFLFCSGLLLFILALPNGDGGKKGAAQEDRQAGDETEEAAGRTDGTAAAASGSVSGKNAASGYAEKLETRIRELLEGVSGVGGVDVMIVLKSSEEQVFHVDADTSVSLSEEYPETGGAASAAGGLEGGEAAGTAGTAGMTGAESSGRMVRQESRSESTVLDGQSKLPVVEKELMPEVAGILISADGGGSAVVKAEITEAMEALFGLPGHKIVVLKRKNEN